MPKENKAALIIKFFLMKTSLQNTAIKVNKIRNIWSASENSGCALCYS